ncbi:MAG: HD domain-containing protein [Clostridia bacterium]|nr:HD domain-containing protein [Clostridia bacterium]
MWRDIRLEQEKQLSPLAAHSVDTLGRRLPEEPCKIRSDYERDADRILYSEDFRRLRHKTQVFFNAKSDHICTRMEHVLYVRAISVTIGRTLGLNQDLINAIALGHDVGHAPFGHTGERVLDSCIKKINPALSFHHESHSLRVVDRLSERISKEKIFEKNGLNLTYEVRDGIVSHCGENYDEYVLYADKMKDPNLIYETEHRKCMPYTLEACVVRLVDKIAYVGRDIEDAIRAKLIDYKDISPEIRCELGATNGEMINTLVLDLIENSYNTEYIRLSRAKGEALREMILTNNKQIYQSGLLRRYEITAKNAIEGLFEILYENAKNLDRKNKSKTMQRLISYIDEKGYGEEEQPEQIVTDYIAGMTDAYALQTFEDLYWI